MGRTLPNIPLNVLSGRCTRNRGETAGPALGTEQDLLLNCVQDLSDSDSLSRPLPGTNSIAFIAAHVIDARYFMVQLLERPARTRSRPLSPMSRRLTM